jgi:hypothetical protein
VKIRNFLLAMPLLISTSALGDIFGTDTAVLTQILSQNIQQLAE